MRIKTVFNILFSFQHQKFKIGKREYQLRITEGNSKMFACPQKFDDSKQVFLVSNLIRKRIQTVFNTSLFSVFESKIIIKPTNCGSMETSVKTELNSPCCPNQQISTNYVQKWNSRTRTYSYGTG